MSRFVHKDKLYKCIQEWRDVFPSAFRLSEATKWLEEYFQREGGNVDTIPVFIDFVKKLELIKVIEKNFLLSKYFFCDEKINELFSDLNSNTRTPALKDPWIRNGARLTRQKTQPEFKTQSNEFDSFRLFSTDLMEYENWNHNDAETWFEEIITRIACLLDTNHDELVGCLQSPESSANIGCNKSAQSMVYLGSAAHFNSVVLNPQRSSEAQVLENVVNAVCLACLETLAQWPNEFAHESKLCDGLCLPHRMLPTAMRFARCSSEHQVPKVVESLLELIFRMWPPGDFSSTLQKLWTDQANCSSNIECSKTYPVSTPTCQTQSKYPSSGSRTVKSRCNSDPSTKFLPPLATPLTGYGIPFVDDSQFFSCCPNRNRRPLFTVELNDSSTVEYQPIAPIAGQHCKNRTVGDGYILEKDLSENVAFEAANEQPFDSIRHGIDELTLGLGSVKLHSTDTSTKDCVSPARFGTSYVHTSSVPTSLKAQVCQSPVINTQVVQWPSERSLDLALASQLALLFLPPYLYARLRVLVLALQRVLRNHCNLAVALADVEVGGNRNTMEGSSMPDTFTTTLNVLAHESAPVLFNSAKSAMVDSVFETGRNWRELLTRLMLCDISGSLFQAPANLMKHSISVTAGNRTKGSFPNMPGNTWSFQTDANLTQSSVWSTVKSHTEPLLLASEQCQTVPLNNGDMAASHSAIPLCVVSIVSASNGEKSCPYESKTAMISEIKPCPVTAEKRLMASTPMPAHQLGPHSPPYRSYSTECFLTEFGLNQETNVTLMDRAHSTQIPHSDRLNVSCMTGRWGASSYASDTMTGFDPQRLASLGNTAHLIKLLNQILNDREMEPRRKMKWLTEFRKAHPDVYWRRFGDQQTSTAYLERLQRRIDVQSQPSVLKRITNAFRRRRSRSRARQQCSASTYRRVGWRQPYVGIARYGRFPPGHLF